MAEVQTIDRKQVKAKIASGNVVVLEALPPMYYEDVHLPGARNMPIDQVDEIAPRLVPDKDDEIVVYCSNAACQNSPQAARRLAQLGYTKVFDYEAGKQDWIEAGLPTESGPDTCSSEVASQPAAGA